MIHLVNSAKMMIF